MSCEQCGEDHDTGQNWGEVLQPTQPWVCHWCKSSNWQLLIYWFKEGERYIHDWPRCPNCKGC